MKRIILILLAVVLTVGMTFAGISCKAEPEVIIETVTETVTETVIETVIETVEVPEEKIVIGVVTAFFAAPYWATFIEVAEDVADDLGWEVIITDGNLEVNAQINQIEDLVAQGVDGIILTANDPVGLNDTIDKVYEETGIPIVLVETMLDPAERDSVAGSIGHNFQLQGSTNAGSVVAYMEENDVEEMNYVIISGSIGYDVTTKRTLGWNEKIAELGYEDKLVMLEEQPGGWVADESQTVMESFLTKYGDDIDLAYAHSDVMASGIVNALEAAGKEPGDVLVVGVDGQEQAINYIKDGWMLQTVTNLPSRAITGGLMLMKDVLEGVDRDYFNDLEISTINASNADEFLPAEF